MGILRLLLALSVLNMHSPFISSFLYIRGDVAVLLFYIISGFYMSMVINGKYAQKEGGLKRFYLNRILRIYPVYLAAMLVSFAVSLYYGINTVFIDNLGLDPLHRGGLVFVNLFIVGMDATFLLGRLGYEPVYVSGYYINVAWSVGIELVFYAIAPFIVLRKPRHTLFILLALALFRAGLVYADLGQLTWLYLFSPAMIIFFAIGHAGYLLYRKIDNWPHTDRLAWGVVILLLFTLAASDIGGGGLYHGYYDDWRNWLFYILFALAVPFIFHLSHSSDWDNALGQLSYPLYLGHPLAILVAHHSGFSNHNSAPLLILVGSLAYAACLHLLVEKPIEAIRNKVRGEAVDKDIEITQNLPFFQKIKMRAPSAQVLLLIAIVVLGLDITQAYFKRSVYKPLHHMAGENFWKNRTVARVDEKGKIPGQLPGPLDIWAGGEPKAIEFIKIYTRETRYTLSLYDSHNSSPPTLEILAGGDRIATIKVSEGNGGQPHEWIAKGKKSEVDFIVPAGKADPGSVITVRSIKGSWIAIERLTARSLPHSLEYLIFGALIISLTAMRIFRSRGG